ncbi:endolytic transglycosylase MltG [Streptomyces tropicalis]|uniref:Endolytic murein transglycosylase n=1 Tax=Streptomyces tropicalis TaxID=3034234 RepID=A0ABT6A4X7_9ACTN|nr:endolytic transglycosylase MltG [Streptomyces tropicalis]MDF3299704.1 endolytic transglycosylase MltG [Streptomyces tropicalis]
MTEYGRGPGPEPWHPEDPLYGDGGWGGQQAHPGPQSYGGQQQHPQSQYGDWSQEQHAGYGGEHPQGQAYPQYDGQGHGGYPGHPQQPYQQGAWDGTGPQPQVPHPAAGPQMAYPADPADPYGQQTVAYDGGQPDFYATPEAYPPPEPPGRRRTEPEPHPDWDPESEAGPGDEQHPFFTGGDQDEDDEHELADDRFGSDRRGGKAKGGKAKGKKRRNGCACLVVVLVLGGGLGGAGYYGYQFYQNRFGVAPDYAGNGTSETVTVEIPKGAGGYDIARKLKEAGVVKSMDAFVAAQSQNPRGKTLQAGAYLLHKQMSAASALALMLDPKSQSNVLVKPGERNAQVYEAVDKQLDLASGTTKKIATTQYKALGLPNWANNNSKILDPLEGFLFPGTYPAAKGMKPDAVLKQMVAQADESYGRYNLAAKAKALNLQDPLQLVTVASLVQAEGKTPDDFRKMAEVVYNRLKPTNTETNQLLQFDSTFNYLKGQSNIHINEKEINSNRSPYNTYTNKGLPPGPIGNPGDDALKAALNPTADGWIYFVATDGMNKTEFARTYAEFQKLKDKFNASSGN